MPKTIDANMITKNKLLYIQRIAYQDSIELSYYKNDERKTTDEIFSELLDWYLRNKEFDRNYFVRGSDRAGIVIKEYPLKKIISIRDRYNRVGSDDSYNILLSDKYLFYLMCKNWNLPTQDLQAFYNGNDFVQFSQFIDGQTYFIKKLDGYGGSVSGVCTFNGKLDKFDMNDSYYTVNELEDKIGSPFIVQSKIIQHDSINRLYPHTINTIRVMSTYLDGDVKIHCYQIKLGTKKQTMDTWGKGAILIKIDSDTGKLNRNGYYKFVSYDIHKKGITTFHPETEIEFEGYQIPYFSEIQVLVKEAHAKFNQTYAIGWDVVITKNGPILLEGNHNWGSSSLQVTQGYSIINDIFYMEKSLNPDTV